LAFRLAKAFGVEITEVFKIEEECDEDV